MKRYTQEEFIKEFGQENYNLVSSVSDYATPKPPKQPTGTQEFLARQGISENPNADLGEKFSTQAQRVAEQVPQNVGFVLGEMFGGPIGAGLGTAGGEALVQGAQKISGQRDKIDFGKIAKEGAIGAVIPPVFKAGGALLKSGGKALLENFIKPFMGDVVKPAGRVLEAGLQGTKKVFPGITEEASQAIKLYPKEVEALASQKSMPVNPLISKIEQAQSGLIEKSSKELAMAKDIFAKSGEKFVYDTFGAIRGINKSLQEKFGIQFGKEGIEAVAGKATPTGIGSSERRILNDIANTIKGAKVSSPEELAALKSTLRDEAKSLFSTPNQIGSKKATAIFQNIIGQLDEYVPAGIKEANKLYSSRRKLAETIQNELIPETKSGVISPSAINKIKSLSKEEVQGLRGDLFEQLKGETGLDLMKEINIWNAAREINPNLIPQDIGGITRGLQKAANPVIGRIKLEMAKGKVSSESVKALRQSIGKGELKGPDVLELFSNFTKAAKPATKLATYDLISALMSGGEENQK